MGLREANLLRPLEEVVGSTVSGVVERSSDIVEELMEGGRVEEGVRVEGKNPDEKNGESWSFEKERRHRRRTCPRRERCS